MNNRFIAIVGGIAASVLLILSLSSFEAAASEKSEILAATRAYVDAQAHGMKYKMVIRGQTAKWASVAVLPKENIEGAAVILEKVGGKWIPRDMGTDLSDWESEAPELFK